MVKVLTEAASSSNECVGRTSPGGGLRSGGTAPRRPQTRPGKNKQVSALGPGSSSGTTTQEARWGTRAARLCAAGPPFERGEISFGSHGTVQSASPLCEAAPVCFGIICHFSNASWYFTRTVRVGRRLSRSARARLPPLVAGGRPLRERSCALSHTGITLGGGSLGSCVDEERSQLRELM